MILFGHHEGATYEAYLQAVNAIIDQANNLPNLTFLQPITSPPPRTSSRADDMAAFFADHERSIRPLEYIWETMETIDPALRQQIEDDFGRDIYAPVDVLTFTGGQETDPRKVSNCLQAVSNNYETILERIIEHRFMELERQQEEPSQTVIVFGMRTGISFDDYIAARNFLREEANKILRKIRLPDIPNPQDPGLSTP
jgi:hypothetical protein